VRRLIIIAPVLLMGAAILTRADAQASSRSPARSIAIHVARVESAQIQVRPTSGPAGIQVSVRGRGWGLGCPILINFTDAHGTLFFLATVRPPTSTFTISGVIDSNAAPGAGSVIAAQGIPHYPRQCTGGSSASAAFTVTQLGASESWQAVLGNAATQRRDR
jgi:hypothetical protein